MVKAWQSNSKEENISRTDIKGAANSKKKQDHHLIRKEYIKPSELNMYITPSINCSVKHTLILLVYSVTPNRQKRDLIRSTWGDTRIYDNMTQKFNLQLLFLIGEMENIQELQDESGIYGDLWVARFEDEYIRPTRKCVYALI